MGHLLLEWQRNTWGMLNTGVVGSGLTWAVNVIIVLWSIAFPMKHSFLPNDSVKSSVSVASLASNVSLPSLPSWKWYIPILLCTDNISSIWKHIDPPIGRWKGFAGHSERNLPIKLGRTMWALYHVHIQWFHLSPHALASTHKSYSYDIKFQENGKIKQNNSIYTGSIEVYIV